MSGLPCHPAAFAWAVNRGRRIEVKMNNPLKPGSRITLDFSGESDANRTFQCNVLRRITLTSSDQGPLRVFEAFVVNVTPAFVGPPPIGHRNLLVLVPVDRFSGDGWMEARASVPLRADLDLEAVKLLKVEDLWSLIPPRINFSSDAKPA